MQDVDLRINLDERRPRHHVSSVIERQYHIGRSIIRRWIYVLPSCHPGATACSKIIGGPADN
jgi:hypothetical protein